ncbi:uncharacterized protein LOC126279107 [Schistocerca gregaria]|uniref:uncharacterized protein LOC126279107 n=1 Tax=Schistocerca gregaria TaxID=7010 RepID=UPI00211E08F5|nr:uncharacterized protein LOC126279107 [Schistocerca gregaria]
MVSLAYNSPGNTIYLNFGFRSSRLESTESFTALADEFCQQKLLHFIMLIFNCNTAKQVLQWHVRKITNSRGLIEQLAHHRHRIRKCGILNFVGEISKVLFGTLDEDDTSYFKSDINLLEGEQKELLRLSKEQAILHSFNHMVNSILLSVILIKDEIKDKQFPVALIEDMGHQLMKVIVLDVLVAGNILSYVLNIPLVDKSVFHMYKLWPLPVEVDRNTRLFTYIAPEKEFLLMDDAKRQYVKLSNEQLVCKKIEPDHSICKETFVLLSTYDHEVCEARMLQPIIKIPAD